MATYLALNLAMLVLAYITLRPTNLVSKSRLVTLGAILLLTLVFDNLMILANLFSYNPEKLLGIYLYKAPIEDFFYVVLAVLIVPALWQRFAKKEQML